MDASKIKELIKQQKKELFSGSFARIKDAEPGEPVPMLNADGEQTHWFTPFNLNRRTAGFSIQNLAGKMIIYGLLTPNAGIKEKIDPGFFLTPPALILDEIKKSYPGFEILSQSFSYDESPQRWGWRINMAKQSQRLTLFVAPDGWYEKREKKLGWEG